jgi:hypothetical protein
MMLYIRGFRLEFYYNGVHSSYASSRNLCAIKCALFWSNSTFSYSVASFWRCEEKWGLRTQIQNDFTVYKLVGSYNTELWKLRVLKSGKRFGSLKSGRTKSVTIHSGDAKTFPFVLLILKPLGHAWWVEEKERKYGTEDEVPESTAFRAPKWSFSSWYTDSLLKTADTAFYTEPIEYYQHCIFTNLPLFVCNNSITSTLSQTAT